jgi:hypothetical protein
MRVGSWVTCENNYSHRGVKVGFFKTPDLLPKISDLGANWSTLEALQRKAIAQHLIREWIGPSIVKNEEAFAIKLSELKEIQTLSIQDALKKLLFYIMTQHEFLTY